MTTSKPQKRLAHNNCEANNNCSKSQKLESSKIDGFLSETNKFHPQCCFFPLLITVPFYPEFLGSNFSEQAIEEYEEKINTVYNNKSWNLLQRWTNSPKLKLKKKSTYIGGVESERQQRISKKTCRGEEQEQEDSSRDRPGVIK